VKKTYPGICNINFVYMYNAHVEFERMYMGNPNIVSNCISGKTQLMTWLR